MKRPADPLAGRGAASDRPGRQELWRSLIAHLRHELRTSLTAIVGYGDHLLECLPLDAPTSTFDALNGLRGIGASVLAQVNERISEEALGGRDSQALLRSLRELNDATEPHTSKIEPLCAELLSRFEREERFALIPILCRIQAAGVMLRNLIAGYSQSGLPKAPWLGLPPVQDEAPLLAPTSPARAGSLGGRLLVVDDNSVNRDMLSACLERRGYEVDQAPGGRTALQLIRENDYDLILLDLVMPDLSGLDVLEKLRDEGRLGLAPVVLLSASDKLGDVARGIECGAEDYVTKPFNMVLLQARIRACLELKRLRQCEEAYVTLLREHQARAEEAQRAPAGRARGGAGEQGGG
ncbi:response regulator transcription factor [Sorangium sp. So ce394]|uniref:response regulator transcription factor n=1 Tax=Sorangium sp. So ce394 TaxID=3133310 RepID=UPI003F5BF74E